MKVLWIIASFTLIFNLSFSQTVIGSIGQDASNGGVMIESTLGETVIATGSTTNAMVTQGFHQPSIEVDAIEEDERLEISYYPNPSSGITNFQSNTPVFIEILDAKGTLVIAKLKESTTHQLDLTDLENGIYLIRVSSSEDEIFNTYKLIKN